MKTFRLKYAADCDDSCPKTFEAATEPGIGDVILVSNGFYHCVYNKITQKTGVRLDLAKSSTSPEEAWLLAEQSGHYPKKQKPRAVPRRR